MKLFRLVVLGAMIAAVAAFAGVGRPDRASGDSPASTAARSITVSGTGMVAATPNQAAFTFGVNTRSKTARVTPNMLGLPEDIQQRHRGHVPPPRGGQ